MTTAKKKTKKKSTKKKKASKKKLKVVEKSTSLAKQIVPLLPLRDIVIFPHMVVPFFVGREKSVCALETAMKEKTEILLCAQKDSSLDEPEIEDLHDVGTLAKIEQLVKLPDGTLKVLVIGRVRAKVLKVLAHEPCFLVESFEAPEDLDAASSVNALVRAIRKTFESYVKLNKRIPAEVLISVESIEDASRLADTIAAHLNVKVEKKQELLNLSHLQQRMEFLLSLIEAEVEILRVEKRIRSRVRRQMERGQKEYYLNEQMAAIQKELGEADEFKVEIDEIREKIDQAGMSLEAKERAESELRKLKMMPPMSAEATVIRNYLDCLLDLPWKTETKDNLDLNHALKVLDEDHYGLTKIKDRISEYIAVQNLNPNLKAPILCFVGPPGVGKTSLGESIARSLERKFVRVSLGGLRDEAEIRGHRKTYVGAMPGKIINAVKKAGSKNPVILLDELDKMGSDFRGDPSSAMLEVLDPAQNDHFADHYLEIDWDLSSCLFVATANSFRGVPQPLIDRMEIIEVPSYTESEKLEIAKRHLLPKQLSSHGMDNIKVEFSDDALLELIRYYTREAGVRNLNREIGGVVRKLAKKIVQDKKKDNSQKVEPALVVNLLGPHKHKFGSIEKHDQVGLCTGLAWTEVGGDTLQIEVAILPGKGKLTSTGKLGDVMQESIQAAYSYVRSRHKELNLQKDFYQSIDIHIHIPEGAIPKDGPSAGITMATSLVSALTNRWVRKDVAMTGEITLRGNVLPIGGLKEKLLAAHRAGIKTVIIPDENTKDLHDVAKEITDKLEIIAVSNIDEVLEIALVLEEKDPLLGELHNARMRSLVAKKGQRTRIN